jgi:hypothetical protein
MESLSTPFTRMYPPSEGCIHPRFFHTLSQYKIQNPEENQKVLVTGYSAKLERKKIFKIETDVFYHLETL